MKNKKEIILLLVGILILITLIAGASYAYFKAQTNSSAFFDIDITSGTTDNLTFSTDNNLVLNVSLETLNREAGDLSSSSIARVRLIANDKTNVAEDKYNVYLLLEENDIEYSSYTKGTDTKKYMTKEEKRIDKNNNVLDGYTPVPELVLRVRKNKDEYNEINERLTKLSDNSYDITEEEGLYAIAEDVLIKANNEQTDTWEVIITYKNLDYNQQLNSGGSLKGKVIITKEKLINRIETINDLVDLSNEVNAGDTKEGKYYVLTKDLDFNNINDYREGGEVLKEELTTGSGFTPIGSFQNVFSGNFDGGKHIINNLFISNTIDKSASIGLIGYSVNNKISNLTVGGSIHTLYSANIGGIVGSTNNVIIS